MGDFEKYVMKAILDNDNRAYGMQVQKRIQEAIGREYALAAVYSTLARLEKKGWLKSKKGQSSGVRGGKAKMFYQATVAGRVNLRQSMANLHRFGLYDYRVVRSAS